MRFAFLVFSAAAVATVTGCGSTPPTPPDGAWSFTMDGDSPTTGTETCQLGAISSTLGDVRSTEIVTRIIDGTQPTTEGGMLTASVSCTVAGTTTFNVQGTANVSTPGQEPTKALTINIPMITSAATSAANGAPGTVTFANSGTPGTADIPYSGTCSFYFVPGSGEGVAAGKIWGAFTCDSVSNAQQQSACGVSQSFFVFENCATTM
jgi:hypothetical protein